MRLGIVTCTTNEQRSAPCLQTWRDQATDDTEITIYTMFNGGAFGEYLGTVPAFRAGVDYVLANTDVDVIACLHDDLEIDEVGWDEKVLRYFARYPQMGLAGFGGAKGLGHERLYEVPYDPMHLARSGFRSDLVDAEIHGMRSLLAEPVACLDGFSQIGRRDFWLGAHTTQPGNYWVRPWQELENLGIIHHGYDGMLGCLAARYGWQTWYIPLRCTHRGGRTAVGDPGYQAWAKTKHPEGDHGLWQDAHRIWYEAFKDVLPLRV